MSFLDNPNTVSGEVIGEETTPATPEQLARQKVAVEKFVAALEDIYPGERVANLLYALVPKTSTSTVN